jgi:outer membrane protein assembly factor BamB
MRSGPSLAMIAVIGTLVAGCSSGSSGPSCSFDNPAVLARSTWPKFRRDVQNTGHIDDVVLSTTPTRLWMFPPEGEAPKLAFAASPVINDAGDRIYIGNTNGVLYRLQTSDGRLDLTFVFSIPNPITSTALLALRSGNDAIFVGGGNGFLYGLDGNLFLSDGVTAANQPDAWPTTLGGYIGASPTLGSDGTVYAGALSATSVSGSFLGVCPNGVERFGIFGQVVQSSAAIGPDGIAYFGADDQQLRAVMPDGTFEWAFAVSGPILTAPVVDVENGLTAAIYIADNGGRVFKVEPSGLPANGFTTFGPVGPIGSSPALAGGRLYFGSDDGNLYAVDATTGALVWKFPTGGKIVSSPAVATDAAQSTTTIVVGSNDGNLYFVDQDGMSAAPAVTIGAAVSSSPAIGSDGTVYVGADDGRVYAIR